MIAVIADEDREKHPAEVHRMVLAGYTKELCEGGVEVRFHARCSHTERASAGQRQSRTVVTHTADERCPLTLHAREASASPVHVLPMWMWMPHLRDAPKARGGRRRGRGWSPH